MSLLRQKRDTAIRAARPSVPAIASPGAVFIAVISRSLARARQAASPLASYRDRPVLARGRPKTAGHGAGHALVRCPAETPGHMLADTATMGPERQFPQCRHPALVSDPATAPASSDFSPWPGCEASESMSAWPTAWPAARRVAGPRQAASPGRQRLRTAAALPGN
jgi:hypothetical protein